MDALTWIISTLLAAVLFGREMRLHKATKDRLRQSEAYLQSARDLAAERLVRITQQQSRLDLATARNEELTTELRDLKDSQGRLLQAIEKEVQRSKDSRVEPVVIVN